MRGKFKYEGNELLKGGRGVPSPMGWGFSLDGLGYDF